MPLSEYDDTNRMALWENDRKRTDRDKDFTGNLSAECPHCSKVTEYFAGLWDNGADADGRRPRFKGSIQPKTATAGAPRAPAGRAPLRGGRTSAAPRSAPMPDDEIPF